MILGIGYDLVDISRISRAIEKWGQPFMKKILSPQELAVYQNRFQNATSKDSISFYIAARFAAKEAAVKALGTGFRDDISLRHIIILPDSIGKPLLSFSDHAERKATELGVTQTFVSLTHEKSMAGAIVILEGLSL